MGERPTASACSSYTRKEHNSSTALLLPSPWTAAMWLQLTVRAQFFGAPPGQAYPKE